MKKILLLTIIGVFALAAPQNLPAQPSSMPKREMRAAWLTTVKGLDWPRHPAQDAQGIKMQKDELCQLLDSLQAIHINTILLQTRVRGDVIYPSAIEPFCGIFSGTPGKSPGYDPLAFAIDECHKRGMLIHAWIVTIPLGDNSYIHSLGKQSLPVQHPEQCTHFKKAWYMEPSHPETISHLSDLLEEILLHYDVDGIHFDYIRYPEFSSNYPDNRAYKAAKTHLNKADWRRENISQLAKALYIKVKSIKPWVCVSAASLGKYGDLSRYSSKGWNAYHTVHQAAQTWLRDGYMDALFPMLYYKGDNFYPFVSDWHEHEYGRLVIPGLGAYQICPEESNWPLDEIIRQIHVTRSHHMGGIAFFRTLHLINNPKGIYDQLKLLFATPALSPAMPWINNTIPSMPTNLHVQQEGAVTLLRWEGTAEDVCYNIYASDTFPVNTEDANNLLATYVRDTHWYDHTFLSNNQRHYAIRAINRYGIESEPLIWKRPSRKETPRKDFIRQLHKGEFKKP